MRALYFLGWLLATPLVLAYLLWRSRRQPAYRAHWGERFGLVRVKTGFSTPLIWIHAVSVGETRAALPLVRAMAQRWPQARFLITCMTPTGRETAQALFAPMLGPRFAQAYLPYDGYRAPARFLEAWRPAVGVLMETELWPALVQAAAARQIPVALVNARLSARSAARGAWQRSLIVPAAQRLAVVCAQSEADAQRIQALTGRSVEAITGNLKFDTTPSVSRIEQGRAWQGRIGRPVVLAASTRDGEEPLLWSAWGRHAPDASPHAPLLVIVPRHPQRFDAVIEAARIAGLQVARRAALEDPQTDWSRVDLLVGDSMGEMDAWYATAAITIMGGSLRPFGSQNPIEPIAVGCPVLLGPSVFNFAEVAAGALACGAARAVTDGDEAIRLALTLLTDSAALSGMSKSGQAFAAIHRGATARTLAALAPALSGLTTTRPPAPEGH